MNLTKRLNIDKETVMKSKSLKLVTSRKTNVYPNNKKNNKVKSKPLELYELAGKNHQFEVIK
jgi:hypothetical protein